MVSEKTDVVILTFKPDEKLLKILKMLSAQKLKPNRIILMNTEEKYFSRVLDGCRELEITDNLEIHHISKKEFNHGRTRNEGASYSDAEYLVFMTQDAVPADDELISRLYMAARTEKTAAAYARQLPNEDCGLTERYNRAFNYPDRDRIKTSKDIPKYGIKTFFCSNVCACYKRSVFDELGGFVDRTIFNEDMIFASNAVRKGYAIRYVSKARVYHSHDYSVSEQYHRNFDLGVSQAEHPEVFEGISSEKEGMKLIKGSVRYLAKERKLYLLPDFFLKCAARYIGYKKGIHYRRMSRKAILRATANPDYFWDKWSRAEE